MSFTHRAAVAVLGSALILALACGFAESPVAADAGTLAVRGDQPAGDALPSDTEFALTGTDH